MTHALAVAGLIANTTGALLLIRFPSKINGYLPNGRAYGTFAGPPTAKGRRLYLIGVVGYRAALWLLVAGFLLQLLDLLRS